MPKRLITKKQERAFRLCHHDFSGATQEEAAKIMGISQPALHYLLARAKKALPQYFPIMTKQEAKIHYYYMIDGWEVKEIAEYMELTERAVYDSFKRAQRKGVRFAKPVGRIALLNDLRPAGDYENNDGDHTNKPSDWIDSKIKQQF